MRANRRAPVPDLLLTTAAVLAFALASGAHADPAARAGASSSAGGNAAAGIEASGAERIVSLNPSLTETLVALGAAERLVGIDEYSARALPGLRELPRVGGLFNPSLESVVALRPDLVVIVPGAQQRDARDRLEALGVRVLELPNITLAEVLASIEVLGDEVGAAAGARARVAEIERVFREVRTRTSDLAHPRAVLVIQRDPLFVAGGGSFLDQMLRAAGAVNVGAELPGPYPRTGAEWLIAGAPDVILDATGEPLSPAAYFARWPSLPAVARGRARAVSPDIMRPGPYLDRALLDLARDIHGERFGRR